MKIAKCKINKMNENNEKNETNDFFLDKNIKFFIMGYGRRGRENKHCLPPAPDLMPMERKTKDGNEICLRDK